MDDPVAGLDIGTSGCRMEFLFRKTADVRNIVPVSFPGGPNMLEPNEPAEMAIKKTGEGKFIKLFGWAARSIPASDNTIKFANLKALLDNSKENKPARYIIFKNKEALANLGLEITEDDLLRDYYTHLREVLRECLLPPKEQLQRTVLGRRGLENRACLEATPQTAQIPPIGLPVVHRGTHTHYHSTPHPIPTCQNAHARPPPLWRLSAIKPLFVRAPPSVSKVNNITVHVGGNLNVDTKKRVGAAVKSAAKGRVKKVSRETRIREGYIWTGDEDSTTVAEFSDSAGVPYEPLALL
ncbi:uncharacterized protein PAC_04928 [Phialocephala subalpina]|uniref:Hsp70 protein n=1 Tax=Phialocephala subalpina TaxID=576137 RepID=A0A1L7WQK1_9HELO|nr:uncharacterized protein PAC_04928 [Phialocephala subalpina]